MKHSEVQKFIESSYKKNKEVNEIDGYKLDKNLSTAENKVFHNPATKKTIIANRGTIGTVRDWSNNAKAVTGQYKSTKRFQNAKQTQKKAIEKYGKVDKNISHSQGAFVGRELNKKKLTNEHIQVNPASLGSKEKSNVHTIRSDKDIVSVLHKKDKNTQNIKSNSINPLTNHKPSILERSKDKLIGSGVLYVDSHSFDLFNET